ncbi:MAG: succinate dehydrogenase cytochrome b subunit [Ignavibacteriales bacterium]|nr:succinate dehydrogenase cytochrome b subunit [Ignavibacteriales bacterium]
MNSLVSFYRSSIGKKVVMSLTGLFLCLFLVEHLVGNLLLFANDGGHLYEEYSQWLVSNPVIRVIEVVLFASLFGHALSALVVWIKNRRARPVKYAKYRLDENAELASRITMLGGSVIFLFLVVHLWSFFVPLRVTGTTMTAYQLVVQKFSDPWFCAFYLFALVVLGYHLKHGFQSAFQTLGLMHKKYQWLLGLTAFVFWFVLPAGFASLPVYFYFFSPPTPSAVVLGVQ